MGRQIKGYRILIYPFKRFLRNGAWTIEAVQTGFVNNGLIGVSENTVVSHDGILIVAIVVTSENLKRSVPNIKY